jgi:hypothetical protein
VKATPPKSLPRAGAVHGASVPPKAGTPSRSLVSKDMVMVAVPKSALMVGVLKISTGTKRLSAASLPTAKGKQARVDVMPHKIVV